MTRADFIIRLKNHINIGGKNRVAYADAALEEVFINSHYCKQHVDHEMFYFDMLKHRAYAELTLVFIEFVKSNSLMNVRKRLLRSRVRDRGSI